MKLARQLNKLGTETAFAVSSMAAQWAARGHRVFPFHLGDIDLSPPPAIVQAVTAAAGGNYNGYCPGAGIPLLREQLARVLGEERGLEYGADNVSVQPGGKPTIGKFLAAVMNPGDEVLYPMPGFPIYESQITYQGGIAVPYHYRPNADGSFALDMDGLRAAVTPKTRAMIYNNHHNPTGASATPEELAAVAELLSANDLWALADEAYCNIRFDDAPLRSLAAQPGMHERTVILFTCSKQFAMTGWRLGAALGPANVIAAISTFNTNMESCTTHFIQQAVAEVLRESGTDGVSTLVAPLLSQLKQRRDSMVDALNAIDGIAIASPPSGFFVYADASEVLKRKKLPDANVLMNQSLHNSGASFCTGEHFGDIKDTKYIRFAFSSIGIDEAREGITAWGRWVESS